MWHVVSFASGLDWKRPAKEKEKLPASSNEDELTAGHRSPGAPSKARLVELSHYGPRGVRLPRGSPTPEFYTPRPERYKAKADALRAQSTRCIQRSGDAIESNMSSNSPVTDNGQYPAVSMPEELLETQPITYATFDTDHESVWNDPEASPDSNGWYAEYMRWEASLDVHMFPENNEQEDTIHLFTETFIPSEPLCPVTVPAPFGSGRKEKVKPDQEYSASAAAFGYKGSYSQYPPQTNVRLSRGRVNGDDPNDNNNGSGSGEKRGGRGGEGGGRGSGRDDEDDREADNEQVAVTSQSPPGLPTQQQGIQQPLPLRYGESRRALPNDPRLGWRCCNCAATLFNSGALDYHCLNSDCQHIRCENCPTEFLELQNSIPRREKHHFRFLETVFGTSHVKSRLTWKRKRGHRQDGCGRCSAPDVKPRGFRAGPRGK